MNNYLHFDRPWAEDLRPSPRREFPPAYRAVNPFKVPNGKNI
jgi:hypothetical protein